MLCSDNLFHLFHNIRMSGSDIMVFMNICSKIVKERSPFFHYHLPVSPGHNTNQQGSPRREGEIPPHRLFMGWMCGI